MKYIFLLLFLAVTNILVAQDQKKVDSLTKVIQTTKVDTTKASTLLKLADLYKFDNPKLNLKYSKKALKIYEDRKDYKGQAKTYYYITSYYNNVSKMDSAIWAINKGIKFYRLAGDTLSVLTQKSNIALFDIYRGKGDKAIALLDSIIPLLKKYKDTSTLGKSTLGKAYINKGMYYWKKGYLNLSLEASLSALKIFKDLDDKLYRQTCLTMIGRVYNAELNFNKALETYKEALIVSKSLGNKKFEAQAMMDIAVSYHRLKNYKDAENYLTRTLELSKEINFEYNIARVYSTLGRLHLNQKKYNEAITYLNKSLKMRKSMGFVDGESQVKNSLSRAYFAKENYNKALEYIDQSISNSEKTGQDYDLIDGYNFKSRVYETIGEYQNALLFHKKSKILNDSIFTLKNIQKTEELKIIYETEKKEQQLKIQKNEIDLLNIKGRVSNLQRILLALALALALIAVYAFYQRNKRNKLAKEKAEVDLEFKTKELTTHALHLAKKNEVLNDLKQKAKALKADANADPGYQMLIQTINFDLQDDNNWENFSRYFEQVHKDFNTKAQQQFPNITNNDLRLMALLKMNLSSKEIANILNISNDGIKKARQRLRKKMGLDTSESLEAIVISI